MRAFGKKCWEIFSLFFFLSVILCLWQRGWCSTEERHQIFAQLGPFGPVFSVAFSPDGRYALSGSCDGNIKLWDIESGREIRTLQGHEHCVSSVSFSPDGRYALSGSWDGTLRLWDIVTGKEIKRFYSGKSGVDAVDLSPDGRICLSIQHGYGPCSLRLWDVNTGTLLKEIKGHSHRFRHAVFSPDNRKILIGSEDNTLKLLVIESGKIERLFRGHKGDVTAVAFSPDGRRALSGSDDNTIRLWDAASGKEIGKFEGHTDSVTSVEFSKVGSRILTGGRDQSVRLWDVASGKLIRTLKGHGGDVYSVALSPDSTMALSGSDDHTLKLWNLKTGRPIKTLKGSTGYVNSIALSPDGRLALHGSGDKTLKLWDLSTGQLIKVLRGHTDGVKAVDFSPDGKTILSGSGDKTLKLWDAKTGKLKRTLYGHIKDVNCAAFSPDGRSALSGSSDNTIYLWDLKSGRKLRRFWGHRSKVTSVAFMPDGLFALSGSMDGTVKMWDLTTGEEIESLAFSRKGKLIRSGRSWPYSEKKNAGSDLAVHSVSVSPDGRYVMSGCEKACLLWDADTSRVVTTFKRKPGRIYSSVFSSDGRLALTGRGDGMLSLWDPSDGSKIKTLSGHISRVYSVDISSDKRSAISGSMDGTLRVWDLRSGREVAQFAAFDNGEWLVITPEGYYNSSPRGHDFLNVRIKNKVYGINQFYDVFYRPDIVEHKLKGNDIEPLISITLKDALENPPPTVRIVSAPDKTNRIKARVSFRVRSNGGGIGEIRVFQNGKLVRSDGYYKQVSNKYMEPAKLDDVNSRAIYEQVRGMILSSAGKPALQIIAKQKGKIYEDIIETDVLPGENEISIYAFNGENTIQSIPETTRFSGIREREEPHLYVVAIGIDEYKESSRNLKYAAKDAKDILRRFEKSSAGLFKMPNIHTIRLVDKEATKAGIISKIKEVSKVIRHGDLVVVFFAGHGVLLDSQYYFVTHDYQGQLGRYCLFGPNDIMEISKNFKALSQIFIFDTCHAGGVDYIIRGLYDARISVLAKKLGLHIYSSCSSFENAIDGYDRNGLFTYNLLEGLNNNMAVDEDEDRHVSVVELGKYTKKRTYEISQKIGRRQNPIIINFGKDLSVYRLK